MIVKHQTWDIICKLAILIVWIFLMVGSTIYLIYPQIPSELFILRKSVMFVVYGLMVLPIFIFMKMENMKFNDIGMSFKRIGLQVAIGLIGGLLLFGVFNVAVSLMFGTALSDMAYFRSWDVLCINIISYLLIVGVAEEFMFRGYIQVKISEVFPQNRWIAVIISSLIFALWHVGNYGSPLILLNIFAIGLTLGFARAYIKTAKLPSLMLAHGVLNSLNEIFAQILSLI